ncbi:MAG: glycosyltransferase family 2 protein [Acaryochloridaceae cyanobacterium SU_2_1]|nr:glycosyltransferase family 2 protein [Acaryochloridaceae cyanobacterium SU_2_1]
MIIPVLHEADNILKTLDHLEQIAEGAVYEVIVVDGDPLGSTLAKLSPSDPLVCGILSQPGRGIQLNAGAVIARSTRLLFLHADVLLPQNALVKLCRVLDHYAAGAFDLEINATCLSLRWISRVASLRSRLTRVPYGDQAIFMNRDTFDALGGFADIPIMEDVVFMRRLKKQQIPISILRDRALISARRWETEGILRCTLRNWLLLGLFTWGYSPHQLAKWYRPPQQPLGASRPSEL